MSLIRRIIGKLFGRNGFDAESHEAEVEDLKRETRIAQEQTHYHLGRAGAVFEGLDLDAACTQEPAEEPEERGVRRWP